MQIIKYPQENIIETTCPVCNTLFSYVWPDVRIVDYEKEATTANYRSTGFLKGEYVVNKYRCKKAIIHCPYCKHEIVIPNYHITTPIEKIGERVLTKQEIKDWHYQIY